MYIPFLPQILPHDIWLLVQQFYGTFSTTALFNTCWKKCDILFLKNHMNCEIWMYIYKCFSHVSKSFWAKKYIDRLIYWKPLSWNNPDQNNSDWLNLTYLTKVTKTYSLRQLLTFGHMMDFSFSKFLPPLEENLKTNDTSFESLKIEHLYSCKKWGVASLWGWPCPLDWKSTSSSKTCLELFIAQNL